MHDYAAAPGFLATGRNADGGVSGIPADAARTSHGDVTLRHWGLGPLAADPVLSLSRVQRTSSGGAVADAEIVRVMTADPSDLVGMLPPFAAVRGDESGVTMSADAVGFRQLYYGTDHPVMSTSGLLAGHTAAAALDKRAVAVQSLLGWQLGQRTLFEGISKLPPGATARMDAAGVSVSRASGSDEPELAMDEAVQEAAALLRVGLEKLLDDHPDAVLQLTGGQDSRLLLSAIPPSRRRGLRAMTVGADADGDVRIARAIAATYGLDHQVHGLADISALTPHDAWRRAREAARRLDGHSDPLALAALGFAEENFDQGVRISGVGGEVCRGFYYFGRIRDRPFGREDATKLAGWRMFVNEAVEQGMLREEFASWARGVAEEEAYRALRAGGQEWFRATDELFLRHRVQRWAGTNDTAVGDRRVVVNPMLDADFLRLASRLAPHAKAHSRFFALLQMELDPDLGTIALDGRPAPAAYAYPGAANTLRQVGTTGRKLANKARQRLRRANRTPDGADALAPLIAKHWRDRPEVLADARVLDDFVRPAWIQAVLAGDVAPRASSVALITNLLVAAGG